MHPSISFIPGVASVTIKTKMRYEKERTKRFLQEMCLNRKCIVFNLETCLFLTQLSVSMLSDLDRLYFSFIIILTLWGKSASIKGMLAVNSIYHINQIFINSNQ
jgi:hypothetical protein